MKYIGNNIEVLCRQQNYVDLLNNMYLTLGWIWLEYTFDVNISNPLLLNLRAGLA